MLPADPLAAALAATVRAALAEELQPLAREVAELRAALERSTGGALLDARAAADALGLTPGAFRQRSLRDRDLRALAVPLGPGGRSLRWRRADLERYAGAREAGRRRGELRAVGGR